MDVALAQRIDRYGLSPDKARDQKASTVIGRLALTPKLVDGKPVIVDDEPQMLLSFDQYNALQTYLIVRNKYLLAIEAKRDYVEPPPPPFDRNVTGSHEDFCQHAIERHDKMQLELTRLMIKRRSPNIYSALDNFVVRDVYLEHLENDLRIAADCLHEHFAGGKKQVAA